MIRMAQKLNSPDSVAMFVRAVNGNLNKSILMDLKILAEGLEHLHSNELINKDPLKADIGPAFSKAVIAHLREDKAIDLNSLARSLHVLVRHELMDKATTAELVDMAEKARSKTGDHTKWFNFQFVGLMVGEVKSQSQMFGLKRPKC